MSNFKFLQSQAYDRLKEMILNKQLSFDTIYSETRFARDFGISRTPMRDALQRLVQEGLIDVVPSKGFQLHRITPKDIVDVYTIRAAIEGYCAFQIAKDFSSERADATVALLSESHQQLQNILETKGSIDRFVEEDFAFHQILVDYVGNHTFEEIFSINTYRLKELARESLKQSGRLVTTVTEHQEILSSIVSGDPYRTYLAVLTHMVAPVDINLSTLYSL